MCPSHSDAKNTQSLPSESVVYPPGSMCISVLMCIQAALPQKRDALDMASSTHCNH